MSIFSKDFYMHNMNELNVKSKIIESRKIHSIQYLRGIAAVLIVLYHSTGLIGNSWKELLQNARIGVDIFFIMSGFIIYFITNNKNEMKLSIFAIKRLLRVFPLFLLVWLIVSILCYGDKKFSDVIASAFLFHIDYNAGAPAYGFNLIGPAWTLTYEIYFYILFALCGTLSYRFRGVLSSMLLISLPVMLQLYFNNSFSLTSYAHSNFHLTSLYQSPFKVLSSTMLWEFVGGIILAYVYTTNRERIQNSPKTPRIIVSIILLLFFIYSVFFYGIIPQGITGVFYQSMAIIISALLLEDILNVTVKPLEFLGDISYSMYLVHWAIIKVFITFFPGIWSAKLGFTGLFYFVASTIFISYVLHRFIEKPFISLARKITVR